MNIRIPVYIPDLSGNELDYVSNAVKSTWISSLGSYIDRFESMFSEYCGAKYGVAVMNGTVALHLALKLFDIGPGDEVLIPDLTFIATANCVAYTGAKPVLVDIEPEYWQINAENLERKINGNTKAIIVVHLYGHPVDMDAVMKIAKKHDLVVIEDAAEAHGAKYKGQNVGGIGDISTFSFYGNKIITTGEGGMLITNHKELAEKARFLKDHAMSVEKRYWHPEIGYNYRMTNLQAAIGVAQIERIDEFIQRKRQIAYIYSEYLNGIPGVNLHPEAEWATGTYWMYSILITELYGKNRDSLRKALANHGIDSRPFFYPLHQMPPYFDSNDEYSISDYISAKGLNLPSFPALTDDQVIEISKVIKKYLLEN